jgi:hypothetical protein
MAPTELATKIITRILTDQGSTYDKLEARALQMGIDMNTFQAAMVIVHRSKLIEQSVKYGVIQYKVAVAKPVQPPQGASWVTANYPWPENFEMPFPEIDMSHLFLKGEELEKYKCEAKGRPYVPGRRKAFYVKS